MQLKMEAQGGNYSYIITDDLDSFNAQTINWFLLNNSCLC